MKKNHIQNAIPHYFIGAYNPIPQTEAGIIDSSIETYHGAIEQIGKIESRTINAIIWYERTIIDYEDRITEKDKFLEHLDNEKIEYYKLLALAVNRKCVIQEDVLCQ